MEHLGLACLAASLRRAGLSVEIIDALSARLSFADAAAELARREFSVLGVSILFQDGLRVILDWLESLKASGLAARPLVTGRALLIVAWPSSTRRYVDGL